MASQEATTSLKSVEGSSLKNMEDLMTEIPLMKGMMRGWVGREDDSCLYFRMDMPGLGEKHIKVSMDKMTNVLVIEGEIREDKIGLNEAKEDDEEAVVRKYRATIEIRPKFFKTDEIKTYIKNGVFKVVVPKVEMADGAGKGEKLIQFKMPNMEENPFLNGVRRNWSAKVGSGGSLFVRIDVAGLVDDDISIRREVGIDDDTGGVYDRLVVEGLGEKEPEYEGGGARHIRCKIDNNHFFRTIRFTSVTSGVCILGIPPPALLLKSKYRH